MAKNYLRLVDYQDGVIYGLSYSRDSDTGEIWNDGTVTVTTGNSFRQRIGTCVSVLKRLPGSGPETVGALAEELLKTDPGLKEFPDIARMYFRDLLMIRRGETEQLYFSGDRSAMRTAAASVSPGQAGHILEMLEQTEDRLRANGNPELLTELLLREIRAV